MSEKKLPHGWAYAPDDETKPDQDGSLVRLYGADLSRECLCPHNYGRFRDLNGAIDRANMHAHHYQENPAQF